jgi:hypothetical protein
MAKQQLDWYPVTLNDPKAKAAYQRLKDAQEVVRKEREKLEAILAPKAQKAAPEGTEPVFSYRFGRIAVAFKTPDSGSTSTKDPDNAIAL